MRPQVPASEVFTALFVCTGNLCRSPFAERLGRAYLDELLGDDASFVQLSSAGTRAVVDSDMHPDSALVLQGFGGSAAGFCARQLGAHLLVGADLVLTMTRRQRAVVLELAPRKLAATFTLPEAAGLLAGIDVVEVPDGARPADRARRMVRAMAGARSRRRAGTADDVVDPIGHPLEAHEEAGAAIAATLLPVLERVAAEVRAATGRRSPGRSVSAERPAAPRR